MPDKKWIVTTSADRSVKEVAKELEGAGFVVGDLLEEVGTIVGTGDDQAAERVRAVRGVSDVSQDSPIDIGPPGGDETW
jgi:hypothetical protein